MTEHGTQTMGQVNLSPNRAADPIADVMRAERVFLSERTIRSLEAKIDNASGWRKP
jgi:hypothetical protein